MSTQLIVVDPAHDINLPADPAGPLAHPPEHAIRAWLDNRLLVTGLLLLVGPLGLPALWLNRRFSRITKILGTVAFMLVTVVLPIALTWYWCQTALQPLVDKFAGPQ